METPGLEQGCAHHTKNAIGNDLSDFDRQESISLRSIAFSLKRIADSMDMTDEHMCIPKSLGIIAHVLAGDKI